MPSGDLDLLLLARERAPFSALKAERSTKSGEHAVYLGFKSEKQNNTAGFERVQSYSPQQAVMCVFVLSVLCLALLRTGARRPAEEGPLRFWVVALTVS